MIQLTKEERFRFAAYLKQEAETELGLVKQMEALPPGFGGVANAYKAKAEARMLVAKDLLSLEEF